MHTPLEVSWSDVISRFPSDMNNGVAFVTQNFFTVEKGMNNS